MPEDIICLHPNLSLLLLRILTGVYDEYWTQTDDVFML